MITVRTNPIPIGDGVFGMLHLFEMREATVRAATRWPQGPPAKLRRAAWPFGQESRGSFP